LKDSSIDNVVKQNRLKSLETIGRIFEKYSTTVDKGLKYMEEKIR